MTLPNHQDSNKNPVRIMRNVHEFYIRTHSPPLVVTMGLRLNTRKIEKIQERALRFVFNDFTSPYDVPV